MVASGTYSELQQSGVDFTSLLKKDEEEEGGSEKGEAPRSPRIRTLSQNSSHSLTSSVLSVKDESDQLPVGVLLTSPPPSGSIVRNSIKLS